MTAVLSLLPLVWTRADQEDLALRVRGHLVRMAATSGCPLGIALASVDLLVHLYARVLRVSPESLAHPDRDTLLLSRGDDAAALYGTLAELGFLEPVRLENFLKTSDALHFTPSRKVAGVEFHTGSPAHGIAVGVGIALDAKLRGSPARVFVLAGEEECAEGAAWEALRLASAHRLENFSLVVHRHPGERAPGGVFRDVLADRVRAFGAGVSTIDGHDFGEMESAFSRLPFEPSRPNVLFANTALAKGVPSLEGKKATVGALSPEQGEALLVELLANAPDQVRSRVSSFPFAGPAH